MDEGTAKKTPIPGPGAFHWNAGAWFGTQFGGTIWLLAGALFVRGYPRVTVGWAVAFVVVNVVGTMLWRRRDRIPPYPALLALLSLCFVAAVAAIALLPERDPETAALLGTKGRAWWALAPFPFLLLQFIWLERSAIAAKRRQAKPPSD